MILGFIYFITLVILSGNILNLKNIYLEPFVGEFNLLFSSHGDYHI
jgi:hypothetical protein